MIYKEYLNGPQAGFRGWIENEQGEAIGFVRADGIMDWK